MKAESWGNRQRIKTYEHEKETTRLASRLKDRWPGKCLNANRDLMEAPKLVFTVSLPSSWLNKPRLCAAITPQGVTPFPARGLSLKAVK